MAQRKQAQRKQVNKAQGWRKGKTYMIEEKERPFANAKNVRVKRVPKYSPGAGTFVHFKRLNGILNGYFDDINELDALRKERNKLALRYHSDVGGNDEVMKIINSEYEAKRDSILNKSSMSAEEQSNEIKLDDAIRDAFDAIKSLPGIEIEVIGKWIWVSGNTYQVRKELKSAGLQFIEKYINGYKKPYWVFKGVKSAGRGELTLDEIKAKYGSQTMKKEEQKRLRGTPSARAKFKAAMKRLIKAVSKRRG